MKLKYLLIFLLFSNKGFNQTNCDSTFYNQLIQFRNSKTITDLDFNKCYKIVGKLSKNQCYDYVKVINGEYRFITRLTLIFGEICVKANSPNSVNKYVEYYIKRKGSPEEQLDYSLGDVFQKRPKDAMNEISKRDSITRESLLFGLAFGFGYYRDNQVKLDSTNYKDVYFSVNPEVRNIYPQYKKEIDRVLFHIHTLMKFSMDQTKKN